MIRLGERLSKTKGEYDFAVGQVAEDFPGRPFPGGGRLSGAVRAQGIKQFAESRRRRVNHLTGVARAEEGSVRVHKVILQSLVPGTVDAMRATEYTLQARGNGARLYGDYRCFI